MCEIQQFKTNNTSAYYFVLIYYKKYYISIINVTYTSPDNTSHTRH